MTLYCEISDGLVINYSGIPQPGFIEGPDEATVGWHWDSVGGFRAPEIEPYNIWNPSTELWEYDPALFTVDLKDQISTYRDDKISTIAVEYINPSEVTFSINYDTRTRDALLRKEAVMKLRDSGDPIDFKMPDGSFAQLHIADVQGLFDVGDTHEQKCFSAEKQVYDQHEITPYTDIQSAKDDFDSFLIA